MVDAATAGFYLAVAAAITGDDQTPALLAEARQLDPDQATAWITQLAGIGGQHPAVLPLIAALAAPPADPDGDDRTADGTAE